MTKALRTKLDMAIMVYGAHTNPEDHGTLFYMAQAIANLFTVCAAKVPVAADLYLEDAADWSGIMQGHGAKMGWN